MESNTERNTATADSGATAKPKRLNLHEAAKLSDRSVSTLKRAIYKKTLKSFKVEGSRFILYTELVSWLGYDPLSEPN